MNLFVGVCGSIAAYRSVDFLRALKAQGHNLKVVLTHSAEQFVSPTVLDTFLGEAMLSNKVFDETHSGTEHIAVAKWADAVVVYGATAHFMAQYQAGLAGDFLLTQLLAFEGPVYLMPAMNPSMWAHPATQTNVEALRHRGVEFLGPVAGRVACGDEGVGHLISHEEALAVFWDRATVQTQQTLKNPIQERVLLSMGPMRSQIDPLRFMQNSSSGLMGLEIIRTLVERGASVRVLLGPVDSQIKEAVLDLLSRSNVHDYETAHDYKKLLEIHTPQCDVFYAAAAVLDFEFETLSEKLDRRSEDFLSHLKTLPVEDFAMAFSESKRPDQILVSFSAEVQSDDAHLLKRALEKKQNKKADWTFVNRVSKNSGPLSSHSDAWILNPINGVEFIGENSSKKTLARILVDKIHSV